MCNVASKVLADDDVPRRAISSVKLLLDLSGDILLDVVFFEGGGCDLHTFLLQILAHIDRFDDGLGVGGAGRNAPGRKRIIGEKCSVLSFGHGGGGRSLNVVVSVHALKCRDGVGLELRRYFHIAKIQWLTHKNILGSLESFPL